MTKKQLEKAYSLVIRRMAQDGKCKNSQFFDCGKMGTVKQCSECLSAHFLALAKEKKS